jgi:hypothetical protein
MPSLHAAFSLFLTVFFFPRVARRWRPLLFAYPLAMMVTVLYCAEHYLVDVLAGWTYVLATFALVGAVERWWRHNVDVTDRGRHRLQARRHSWPPPQRPIIAQNSFDPRTEIDHARTVPHEVTLSDQSPTQESLPEPPRPHPPTGETSQPTVAGFPSSSATVTTQIATKSGIPQALARR